MGTAGAPVINQWPEPNYNSLTGMHGASDGIPHAWQEWVLRDPTRLRISEVNMIGGVVEGDVHLPRADIRTSGDCTFRGNITAGNVIISGKITFG